MAEALLALIEEGDLRPTAPRIAERAGVSLRLVFHHFKDLEAVFAEAAKRQLEKVIPTLKEVSADGPLEKRVEAFVAERARLLERVGTIWRAAALQEPFSTEISKRMATVRGWMRGEAERVFAGELGKLRGPARAETQAALGLLVGMGAWEELRRHQGIGDAKARKVLQRAILALLG